MRQNATGRGLLSLAGRYTQPVHRPTSLLPSRSFSSLSCLKYPARVALVAVNNVGLTHPTTILSRLESFHGTHTRFLYPRMSENRLWGDVYFLGMFATLGDFHSIAVIMSSLERLQTHKASPGCCYNSCFRELACVYLRDRAHTVRVWSVCHPRDNSQGGGKERSQSDSAT